MRVFWTWHYNLCFSFWLIYSHLLPFKYQTFLKWFDVLFYNLNFNAFLKEILHSNWWGFFLNFKAWLFIQLNFFNLFFIHFWTLLLFITLEIIFCFRYLLLSLILLLSFIFLSFWLVFLSIQILLNSLSNIFPNFCSILQWFKLTLSIVIDYLFNNHISKASFQDLYFFHISFIVHRMISFLNFLLAKELNDVSLHFIRSWNAVKERNIVMINHNVSKLASN